MHYLPVILLWIISLTQNSLFSQQEKVNWKTPLVSETNQDLQIQIDAQISPGWIVYAMDQSESGPIPLEIEFDNQSRVTLNGEIFSEDIREKYDDIFEQQVSYFKNKFTLRVPVVVTSPASKVIDFTVYYQVCSDVCMNKEKRFQIDSNGNLVEQVHLDQSDENSLLWMNFKGREKLVATTTNKSGWVIFFLGMGAGLLALLTPCVFPMIPLTVSFFYHQGGSATKSVIMALSYGASIVGLYLLLSLPFHFIEGISPNALNTIATSVGLNLFFFIVFVVFALSFFGLFEIQLPSRFVNTVDQKATSSKYFGVFFMALTLALVSFSCTGPILGSLLAGSLSSSDGAIQLSLGMFGFGLALALPFTLFALFPNALNKLPKSGSWMADIKVLLGGIELALALKFLSNADLVSHWGLLKREVFLIIWMVIALSVTTYFILRWRRSKPGRPFFSIMIILLLLFSTYLGTGIFSKQNLVLLSGFPPPDFYSVREEKHLPQGLSVYNDLDQAIQAARDEDKPILIDFTGWACVNCRKMEETVWSVPVVHQLLNKEFIIASLYIDDRSELPKDSQFITTVGGYEKEIKTIGQKWAAFQAVNFQNASQPYYVALASDLQILNTPIQSATAAVYQDWLKEALNNYNSR